MGLWASNGSDPLVKVMDNMAASCSTNSEDFHVGVLRIVNTATPENWYMSGVYIESGPITTTIGSGNSTGSSSSTTTSAPATSSTVASSTSVSSTTTASGPTQTQWGQCGGEWTVSSAGSAASTHGSWNGRYRHWVHGPDDLRKPIHLHGCLSALLLPGECPRVASALVQS